MRNLFHSYWFGLEVPRRAEVAQAIGASVGHLNNVAYGIRPLAPELCATLESVSRGAVCRWHIRPADWWRVWPELVGRPGVPPLPDGAVPLVMPTDADIHEPPSTATAEDERNPSRLVAVAVERERRTWDLGRQARGTGGRT